MKSEAVKGKENKEIWGVMKPMIGSSLPYNNNGESSSLIEILIIRMDAKTAVFENKS